MSTIVLEKEKIMNYSGLDILKTLAIVCVILNHTLPKTSFWISFLYHYVIYMAVPVFMVVSGFLFSHWWQKNEIKSIKQYFTPRYFGKIFLKYAFPFFLILIVEYAFFHRHGVWFVLKKFPLGGVYAVGSYYISVFFQFLIVFPFLHHLADKPQKGTLQIIGLWAVFEIGFMFLMPQFGRVYRLMFLRYILFCWTGILLYRYRINEKFIFKLCVLSLIYITLIFNGTQIKLFNMWAVTSCLTVGYVLFIVWSFLKIKKSFCLPIWLNIGRQTWFIYLFQMIYLQFFARKTPLFFEPRWLQRTLICLIGGIMFFSLYRLLIWSARTAYMWCCHKIFK